jgi:hypothetical protein
MQNIHMGVDPTRITKRARSGLVMGITSVSTIINRLNVDIEELEDRSIDRSISLLQRIKNRKLMI